MSRLFSDQFPDINTNEELGKLHRQYPSYDPSYICQGAGLSRRRKRVWMEKLWQEFEPYADSQFREGFKKDFNGRSWELYLGATFLKRGYTLEPVGDEGPDLKVKKNELYVYVEAVAPGPGDGPDRVPDTLDGKVRSVPEDEMILRISAALSYKKSVYDRYLSKGLIKPKDSFVIALNRSGVALLPDPLLPLVIKCCFGVGDLTLTIPVKDTPSPREKGKSFWSGRMALKKRSGNEVSMLFFENPANAGISAIIYSIDSILNSPMDRRTIGENMCILHNPNARNPIPEGFFVFGEERKVHGDFLSIIRKRKKWRKSF